MATVEEGSGSIGMTFFDAKTTPRPLFAGETASTRRIDRDGWLPASGHLMQM
jgi:hypothetical protein